MQTWIEAASEIAFNALAPATAISTPAMSATSAPMPTCCSACSAAVCGLPDLRRAAGRRCLAARSHAGRLLSEGAGAGAAGWATSVKVNTALWKAHVVLHAGLGLNLLRPDRLAVIAFASSTPARRSSRAARTTCLPLSRR